MVIIEGSRVHALVYFCFHANGLTNPNVFKPKTFCIPREIIPQNFSSSGLVVLEELGNKQTNIQTDRLTERLALSLSDIRK